ncbi:hypothetical protein BpHYR1_025859 [Brachionus plicatilis]|uniref:Uncharacterized protein n=1 Tax=Brachionus plicatilis TaxID=10195 RepID=A0A3M7RDZ8_BRAPC|nr:hypothetical protein BpHYR1_025859 [Brachionus plicatilis]
METCANIQLKGLCVTIRINFIQRKPTPNIFRLNSLKDELKTLESFQNKYLKNNFSKYILHYQEIGMKYPITLRRASIKCSSKIYFSCAPPSSNEIRFNIHYLLIKILKTENHDKDFGVF